MELINKYWQALQSRGFRGDFENRDSHQIAASTDNSIYQIRPRGILYPKTPQEVPKIFQTFEEGDFEGIHFTAKGGSTGTNGQSLNSSILIDFSRYCHHILNSELKKEGGWIEVQPGVVLDQLRTYLKEKGFFFPPDLSPSSRATIGGMINTDACGIGSKSWGRTSNHVLELTWCTPQGKVLRASKGQQGFYFEGDSPLAQQWKGKITQILSSSENEISERFEKMPRFLTGYNLPGFLEEGLVPLLCGSEGTLGVLLSAKLRVLPIPPAKTLYIFGYSDFTQALEHGRSLLQFNPHAIETVDGTIVKMAFASDLGPKLKPLIPEFESIAAVSLVELNSEMPSIQKLCEGFAIPFYYQTQNEIEKQTFWTLRKNGVGLLGRISGLSKPWPFVEDCAVPPEHLPEFIHEFRSLLDSENIEYGMFGHIDAGCLHVRPKINIYDRAEKQKIEWISTQVHELVQKYKGMIGAEHGKGLRSKYLPDYFGPTLYPLLRKIKSLIDPDDICNPGKIARPMESDKELLPIFDNFREGDPVNELTQNFQKAFECNGNGQCHHYHEDESICPSWRRTKDRRQSPKGRADLIRTWTKEPNNKELQSDIIESLEGCLGCEACAHACPIEVNIPEMQVDFYAKVYEKEPRPSWHKALLKGEQLWLLRKKTPYLPWNFFAKRFGPKKLTLPAPPSQYQARLPRKKEHHKVWVLRDSLTELWQPEVFQSIHSIAKGAKVEIGFTKVITTGKIHKQLGDQRGFAKWKTQTKNYLEKAKEKNILILEPTLLHFFQKEFPNLQFLSPQEWLGTLAFEGKLSYEKEKFQYLPHCHEQDPRKPDVENWVKLFKKVGLELEVPKVSCCGQSGSYGFLEQNQTFSRNQWASSWAKKFSINAVSFVTGTSCHHQCNKEGAKAIHPIVWLSENVSFSMANKTPVKAK